MRFKMGIRLVMCGTIYCPIFAFGQTIDVTIRGVDDGVKTNRQQDSKETLVDATLRAIHRSGAEIDALSRIVDFEKKSQQVEAKTHSVLLPGFQVIDSGYVEHGSYQVDRSRQVGSPFNVSQSLPAMAMDPVDMPYIVVRRSNVRRQPHGAATSIGAISPSMEVFVIAISRDRTWAGIRFGSEKIGYVLTSTLQEKKVYLEKQAKKEENLRNKELWVEANARLNQWKGRPYFREDVEYCRRINCVGMGRRCIGMIRSMSPSHYQRLENACNQEVRICKSRCARNVYGDGWDRACPNQKPLVLVIDGERRSTWDCRVP